MKLTQIKKTALLLTTLIVTTSAYASQEQAEEACVSNLIHNGYKMPGSIHAKDLGHNSYKIKGTILSKDDKKRHNFTCNFRHGEVINWKVIPNNSKSDKQAAIAAGAGLLAVLAIAAANDDKHHNNRHENHATGGSAFDDMRYLKKQCKQNIRHHIANEDQAVRKIHLDTTHLHNRTLRGEGGVLFRRGGGSDISYECKFDRQGRIYDGHYRFH